MAAHNTLELQQSLPVTALAGCWKLEAGRATTLKPTHAGVFRIAQGTVWVTFDGPHRGAGNALGDQFLHAGEQIELPAGQSAVVEPWFVEAAAASSPAYFSWEPAVEAARSGARSGAHTNAEWRREVVQPVRDLSVALGLASAALGRLVLGLGHLGSALVGGRHARTATARG